MPRPTPDADSTSSDLVLRCYAPQMVARAFSRASSGVGDCRERLGWRLGFVDVAQRFLLAVLAAQHAGLGLQPGPALKKLVDKLQTPSLGDVSKAVEELADALACQAVDDSLRPLVELFATTPGAGGSRERTAVAKQFQALIDLRNDLFHRDGAPLPDEATAARHLKETEKGLQHLCRSLRLLKRLPLFFLESKDERQDGSVVLHLLRFTGYEPQPQEVVIGDEAVRLPTRVPFVLLSSGDALLLSPYAVVTRNPASGTLEARLLFGWDGQFTYSALDGGARGPVQEGTASLYDKREDLLALKPQAMLRTAAMTPERAEQIRQRLEEDGFPAIEGYLIEGRLGTGASSTVYFGREVFKGKPPGPRVAIKVLHPAVTSHPVQRARLKREYHILSGLDHPSIVKVFRYIETAGPSLVLEYVDGEDLHAAVERKPLRLEQAVRIVEQVLSALGEAHDKNVVHRDVKPSNVLVDRTGNARLIDFGIAAAEDLPRQTRTLDAIGTLGFAAPEQLLRTEDPGPPADLYAVGRLLEFLLTGQLHPPEHLPDGLPAGIHAIIRKATQREIPWRFQTAREMLDALAERKDGKWEGAPVQIGDRLNFSYELQELSGVVDDIYAFLGGEIASDRPVAIALAPRRAPVEQRLRQAVASCPDELRARLGHPRLQHTPDRILFAVLEGKDPGQALSLLLKGESAREAKPLVAEIEELVAPFAPREGEPGWIRALRSHLIGIPGITGGDRNDMFIRQSIATFELLELALRVSRVQDVALRGSRPSPSELDPRTSLGQLVSESCSQGILSSAPKDLVSEITEFIEWRNRVVHKRLYAVEELLLLQPLGALLDLMAEQALQITDPGCLAPAIAEMKDGTWALLVLRGTKPSYESLNGTKRSFDLTPQAVEWLASSDLPTTATAIRDRMVAEMVQIEEMVCRQLQAMPFCGRLEHEPQARHNRTVRRADFLVHSPAGEAILVVECKRNLESKKDWPRTLDQLWTYVLAFDVPFGAVTDGARWRWFRNAGDRGLDEIGGPAEIESYLSRASHDGNSDKATHGNSPSGAGNTDSGIGGGGMSAT